jgi:orotidine-5'-phosphate decarboxylase
MFHGMAENNPGRTKILAVTVLTSLNSRNLSEMGYRDEYARNLSTLVLLKARLALEAGCSGIVCSGHEVAMIKRELGQAIIAVTPGIRPAWTLVAGDDQKRIVTPFQAIRDGADFLVIGRPIRDADDPKQAAEKVAAEIESALV